MQIPSSLAGRLAWYRRAQGLSQRELAKRVGISKATILNIEHGKTGMRVDTMQKLAKALGITCAHLLGEIGLLDDVSSAGAACHS